MIHSKKIFSYFSLSTKNFFSSKSDHSFQTGWIQISKSFFFKLEIKFQRIWSRRGKKKEIPKKKKKVWMVGKDCCCCCCWKLRLSELSTKHPIKLFSLWQHAHLIDKNKGGHEGERKEEENTWKWRKGATTENDFFQFFSVTLKIGNQSCRDAKLLWLPSFSNLKTPLWLICLRTIFQPNKLGQKSIFCQSSARISAGTQSKSGWTAVV